jgi:hypothetical protein
MGEHVGHSAIPEGEEALGEAGDNFVITPDVGVVSKDGRRNAVDEAHRSGPKITSSMRKNQPTARMIMNSSNVIGVVIGVRSEVEHI